MPNQNVKRCQKCVLPEITPAITFDQKGICNYCYNYKELKFKIKGEKELIRQINQHRNENNKYDCMVTLSGGRDSSYTLLKLVKDYGLGVLALNYENPFTDPQAKINIKNAVKILNVDIVRFKLKNKIHERTFENSLLAWLKKPAPALIPIVCVGCKTIWRKIIKIAKLNNIQCIVSGGNMFEDTSFKKVLLNLSPEEEIKTTFMKAIFTVLKEVLKNPSYFKLRYIPTMIKGYLFGDQYALGSRLFGYNLTNIDLFHYIEWNEKEVISRITSELNWDYPHEISSWRFDCQIECMKDLMYLKTIGVTERDDFYSKMVREGVLTREEALKRLEKEIKIQFDKLENILNKTRIHKTSFFNLIKKNSFFRRDWKEN